MAETATLDEIRRQLAAAKRDRSMREISDPRFATGGAKARCDETIRHLEQRLAEAEGRQP